MAGSGVLLSAFGTTKSLELVHRDFFGRFPLGSHLCFIRVFF